MILLVFLITWLCAGFTVATQVAMTALFVCGPFWLGWRLVRGVK